ncbi:serine/threonine-protein kinase ATM isoform X2 [Rhodamnia argentea]|uniref:non-specific serine/threonine protein kinase n=1 Tax=Rhodamnia argentea TaxID=178133 RepID=A0ABM3HNT5_9MYRT|nr:serine/threonine-protein kinase ATM isoform X2 [Rhodamnia argentea]
MAATVTSRDVQEIISKLSSDKAKIREEGIKLLNIWLDGERSFGFCKYLGQHTARLSSNEVPHSETWPFLVKLLIQCVSLEVSSSKRRLPKLTYAKSLRIVVQRAHDTKFSGDDLPLISVAKVLLNHIWDVLSNVPSFQSEYGLILRHLLVVRDYQFHMKKKIYGNMVLLFMEKVETSSSGHSQSNLKEEVFRCISLLQCMLENPPGDYPDNIREEVIDGFVRIFSFVREEGKIARKLLECVNTFLLKDGPNLGCQALKIHKTVQQFVLRTWLASRGRGLKDALILYARLQLNLAKEDDGKGLVEQLLDVVCKDLDQSAASTRGVPWSEVVKDDKFGVLGGSHCGLVELAALVFYKSCISSSKAPSPGKRIKREHAAILLKEALMGGKWSWHAAFCCLLLRYQSCISTDLFTYWFEGICANFERIMNDANTEQSYEGFLWTLRSLQKLSSLLSLSGSLKEFDSGWQLIWNSLMHGLPLFSNITMVDLVITYLIPEDIWDLRLFTRTTSESVLYFISSYFSKKGSQVDPRDMLHLRKNLLRTVLDNLRWKDPTLFNEKIVLLLPASISALCSGYDPFKQRHKWTPLSNFPLSDADSVASGTKGEDQCDNLPDIFDCSVEALTKIDLCCKKEVSLGHLHQEVHLPPRQLREPLLHDLEIHIEGALVFEDPKSKPLSDIFFVCAHLANLIYALNFTRQREEVVVVLSKMAKFLSELLDNATAVIQEPQNDVHSQGCFGPSVLCDGTSAVLISFRSFVSSPIFLEWRNGNALDAVSHRAINQSMQRLLRVLVGLYESRRYERSPQSDVGLSAVDVMLDQYSCQSGGDKSRIVDMELDAGKDFKDVDISPDGGEIDCGIPFSIKSWKLGMISLISCFFSVVPEMTWEMLFGLLKIECDRKVSENILHSICLYPYWSSAVNVSDMVNLLNDMMKMQVNLKLDCGNIVAAICTFTRTLLCLDTDRKYRDSIGFFGDEEFDQSLARLGDMVSEIAEVELLDWLGRLKLVDSICNLVLISPKVGQMLIERLLTMLRDSDYRVRLFLARHIGVLFQTWEGHEELFEDICSNFGVPLVYLMKGKIVPARDVLAAGPQPRPVMETIILTLCHLALHSEKIELQAIFMICVISAIDPCHRMLASAVLDNLSRMLHYTTRLKYLEELMGPIIFCWVTCGVSLAALVEVRNLFVSEVEPSYFVQYCCDWLLPAFILHEDSKSHLTWLAQISGQPLAVLVQNHFVPIFAVCMALHCSKSSGWEKGAMVLQSSILQIAEISETARDNLIKKHMVSIVSHLLSLAYDGLDHPLPFFCKDNISCAIRMVVDGFLDQGDCPSVVGVVDKINIFRPDRVFMFIVEIHHKVASASHHRHRCHRLAEIEVLVNILEHRAAIASTSSYLFNLVGQYIGCHALQDQCCRIIATLLKTFENDPSKEISSVLGEQLQFLVSKLVTCCIPSNANGENPPSGSSQVLSLLHQLVLHSGPSLHDYIRDLEPFPEIKIFDELREFHEDLCMVYSPRDHLLKFAKRSCYLPRRLFLWSLQALHKKLLMGESSVNFDARSTQWHDDPEIRDAVWTLVRMCGCEDADGVGALVSDLLSRVGIGDSHCVVFHRPGEFNRAHVCQPICSGGASKVKLKLQTGIPEELLSAVLRLLKKYLMDDSVVIVEVTSQALRGILSTERGQSALSTFDSYERSLVEIHSRGVNMELVEKLLLDLERKFNVEAIPLENSEVWETFGKTFDTWICPLVFSLIGHCDDVFLRLCQDVVSLKVEVAELLLPYIMVNLAGRKGLDNDFSKMISSQVQEHIFAETNRLTKSIQIFLDVLNGLRLYYSLEGSASASVLSKLECSKYTTISSHGSKTRSSSTKARDSTSKLASSASSHSWEKVYWMSIDYLTVARSAASCGSYFTSIMYVEHWCEENFKSLTLGRPDFSYSEKLPCHIEILVSAITQVNEPDSLYGIIQSHKLTSQIITFEHEGNWSKALEYYDLQVRSKAMVADDKCSRTVLAETLPSTAHPSSSTFDGVTGLGKPYKGIVRSLQKTGCSHVLDLYFQGLTSRRGQFQYDEELNELQYEAAWHAGNWDFSSLYRSTALSSGQQFRCDRFNESLHCCLRSLQDGNLDEFHEKLKDSKQELVWSLSHASEESTEHIYSTIIKLQILYHLGKAWDMRWRNFSSNKLKLYPWKQKVFSESSTPTMDQMVWLNSDWEWIVKRTELHMNLLEPFIAFRGVLLNILSCKDCMVQHLLQSASTLRKGSRFSQAAASLHEFKYLVVGSGEPGSTLCWTGMLEEAKLLRAQGQNEMAISLAKYVSENFPLDEKASDVYRLIGKWLAETRSSNSRTILEKYLKPAVSLAADRKSTDKKSIERQGQTHFHLAHYADALFRSYEERLTSNEWQAAMRLRKHKTLELEALVRRVKRSMKGEKTDYSVKIQELQRQLAMDKEEAEKLQDDRDNLLNLALEGYKRCLVIADKYDVRVVFRLVSLWFSLSSRQNIINSMLSTIDEVQSYKFVPLVYQIASRMGSSKDTQGPHGFQFALISLVKKMAMDHPYHTVFQLLALANGDRIKDKQHSRNSFVVDMDKKLAAENLLQELSAHHGAIIRQMKQMVEIYIKLAELETRREDTNKKISLPREIRNLRELELVPVVTASFPIDRSCQYKEGSFPYFMGLEDTITVMNGINAPKVVECFDSDGHKYRQLAKSGNDDLRQDAVMEQFFGLVNTFLHNHRDTRKRRLGVRTYKVIPFTPSAGVLEWVNGTLPLGEYLIGSMRNGGAHGQYGRGDWSFQKCRVHMANEKDKRKAFQEVCKNFRPVMHHFFLERYSLPADWFERRLAYTRSVATSSMVGYIVGLGDRHSMNILIDQATAEVVHIDLGVAFEQGLTLKTPERVPFRLTRDIIDGMGVTGVEGVFRRCCEETISVMRTNKEALLTIVEVFIHDPLYKWALSPLKALQRQKETSDDLETYFEDSQDECEGNKDATRALMRVKQKLDGYEEGERRSVHGQVQQLIQDAIDPDRLCQLYPGWGAWL